MLNGSDSKYKLELPLPSDQTVKQAESIMLEMIAEYPFKPIITYSTFDGNINMTHKLMFIYDISAVIIEKKLKYE